jgi:hypothetical protein
MRLVMTACATLGLLLSAACDSGAGPSDQGTIGDPSEQDPIASEPIDETPIVETPIDETPVVETPIDETPLEPEIEAYPAGPYGTGYLDISADLEFFDPWTGATPRLSDYYKSDEVSVLLISSAAGWCTACMYEAWDLVDVYDKYHDRGLEVLYTLYENTQGQPIFQDDATDDEITADMNFFLGWQESLGQRIGLPVREANYPTVVDRDFVLGAYFDAAATPLTLIIDTSDMRILYRQVGYAKGTVEQMVKGHL